MNILGSHISDHENPGLLKYGFMSIGKHLQY
jgi:hypothetical protein